MKKEAAALILVLLMEFLAFGSSDAFSQTEKKFVEVSCYDTGEFIIKNIPDKGDVSAKAGRSWIPVFGEWKESEELWRFNSEEAVFMNLQKTAQQVKVGKSAYSVTCPAFVFSCRLINISINACYRRNETFYGRFTAYSIRYDKKNEFRFEKPYLLTYKVKTEEGRELTHSPVILSPEFKNVSISRTRRVGSNHFTLRWNTTSDIKKFSIQYQECKNRKYNFYDAFQCTELPTCSTDKGCSENEACEDNLCVPISCGACQHAEEHKCRDYECCSSTDCSEEAYCTSNECFPLICEYNEATVDHACEKLECGEDEYAYNNSCMKLNCEENKIAGNHVCTECGGDEKAANNACEKLSCGLLKKARNHKCVSVLKLLFGKKHDAGGVI